MQTTKEPVKENKGHTPRSGVFFSKLSPAALDDLESMEHASAYPAGMILFSEKQTPQGIYIIHSGEVKLSMNSTEGKRLIVRIAKAGEILGLASAVSGGPSEITAETLHPAKIAIIERAEFLGFLRRHPEVYQPLTVELSRHLNMVCEQLRTVGLSSSAPEKLARLLLDWSENGQTTDAGTRFHFPLTHEEIGEFIGTSRETVTRTLSTFKSRRLVSCHGATLTITSRMALETFARC
jgi:CRP/FNR family transcriptional regulator, cyclic AMP receptor protein